MGQGVSLKEIVEKMNLKNLTPDVDLVEKYVQVPDRESDRRDVKR